MTFLLKHSVFYTTLSELLSDNFSHVLSIFIIILASAGNFEHMEADKKYGVLIRIALDFL